MIQETLAIFRMDKPKYLLLKPHYILVLKIVTIILKTSHFCKVLITALLTGRENDP